LLLLFLRPKVNLKPVKVSSRFRVSSKARDNRVNKVAVKRAVEAAVNRPALPNQLHAGLTVVRD
jgi:hypothetical protein